MLLDKFRGTEAAVWSSILAEIVVGYPRRLEPRWNLI